jgi:hypothetical protein
MLEEVKQAAPGKLDELHLRDEAARCARRSPILPRQSIIMWRSIFRRLDRKTSPTCGRSPVD